MHATPFPSLFPLSAIQVVSALEAIWNAVHRFVADWAKDLPRTPLFCGFISPTRDAWKGLKFGSMCDAHFLWNVVPTSITNEYISSFVAMHTIMASLANDNEPQWNRLQPFPTNPANRLSCIVSNRPYTRSSSSRWTLLLHPPKTTTAAKAPNNLTEVCESLTSAVLHQIQFI